MIFLLLLLLGFFCFLFKRSDILLSLKIYADVIADSDGNW